jgi:hypothetical protein
MLRIQIGGTGADDVGPQPDVAAEEDPIWSFGDNLSEVLPRVSPFTS